MQICGKEFTEADLQWIRDQIDSRPDLNRVALSRLFCLHAGWRKPDGGLKEMSCRVAMLRLDRGGLIGLPAPRTRPAPVGQIKRTRRAEPEPRIELNAGSLDLSLEPVTRKTSALWNELIDRYHYLGYGRMGGAQMRFFVHAGTRPVALLGFSAAAWRVAPRDKFIGWTETFRKERLHRVINNSRFLILPWIASKNLASRILALSARSLPEHWDKQYHYRPLLLETFVEEARFAGTCYKAANWICVGKTRGRGKWDRTHTHDKPVKTIWLYPLAHRFREELCR